MVAAILLTIFGTLLTGALVALAMAVMVDSKYNTIKAMCLGGIAAVVAPVTLMVAPAINSFVNGGMVKEQEKLEVRNYKLINLGSEISASVYHWYVEVNDDLTFTVREEINGVNKIKRIPATYDIKIDKSLQFGELKLTWKTHKEYWKHVWYNLDDKANEVKEDYTLWMSEETNNALGIKKDGK